MDYVRKDLIDVNKLLKTLCLLLSLLLLVQAPLLAIAEGETAEEQEEIQFPEELIVGHPTITKGDFFTEMFGNDTADIDVRALIHGYNLVNWDQNQGVYVMDPSVVTEYQIVLDELGNKTYRMMLADDLCYSDGTPITAWDYAFSILLMMSPEVEKIGGKIYRAEHLLGYDDYIATRIKIMNGEELDFSNTDHGDTFSLGGVEVHNDRELWITLDHEFLPYFFETGLLMTVPYPISVIAPGCKVYDDGNGIYLGNADNKDASFTEPVFTAELLKKTILDPETGYNSHPSVVSGPYVIADGGKAWDPETGDGHFEINEYFKGAWMHNTLPGPDYSGPVHYIQVVDDEGNPKKDASGNEVWLVKPTIEKICFKVADNDTMIQQLADGELHLVNKVTYGPTIMEGMQGETAINAGIQNQYYPRIGLSFLTFTYDWPTVHDMEVRQAIAYCMDREGLTQRYCGNNGLVMDGYFGLEQWEYQLVTGRISYPVNFLPSIDALGTKISEAEEEENKRKKKMKFMYYEDDAEYEACIAAWDMLRKRWQDDEGNTLLVHYTVDLDEANRLLDKCGWVLNREGNAYRAGEDDVRCKKLGDEIVPLELKMMYPKGNHMIEFMQEEGMFTDNLNKVGIRLEFVAEPMESLLRYYYRETPRTTDMIYLATNFHVIVDPSITYSTDETVGHLVWNNTYSDDEELFRDAVNMRKTEPGSYYEYVEKWMTFQERYNEVLPTIPVYSNIYYDFYSNYLQNYKIINNVTWSQAILAAYFGLPETEEPEAEEEELAEDEMSFGD